MNDAIREELITFNPGKWADMPPATRPRSVIWTPERVVEDAYKNGSGRCPPAVEGDGGFHDRCIAAAPSPNFEQDMNAEGGLLGIELLGGIGEALSPFLDFVDPTVDVRACTNGDQAACWWAAIGVFPFGKLGRLSRMLDDMTGGGGSLHYIPAPKTISGIPGLTPARPKTSVIKGGGLRKRWKDSQGNIYEWDSQRGELEKYNKKGKHLGVYDPSTGKMIKGPKKGRTVEP